MAKAEKPADKPKRTIDDLLVEHYDNEEVRQFIKDDVTARGTEKAIMRGELKLPTQQDAESHMRRVQADSLDEDE